MITCGVPQGSFLGPLLYIIYLNDFTSCLQFSKANLYADDTETTISSSDIGNLTRSFQTELDNISDWMRGNILSVNPDKTEFMVIGNPRRKNKFADLPPFFLGQNEISRVDKTKYLGVMVDDKLNWGNKFRSVKGKITSGLAALKVLRNIIPQSQLMHVYYALIESHLRYANVVWGSLSDTKMEALQPLQNRAFDIIDSSRFKDSRERKSLNVNQLMRFDRSVMTFKIVNNLCSEILQNKFQESSSISKYKTKNIRDLHFQRPNLECVKKSFYYTGVGAWNSIPQPIKDARSIIT